MFAIGELDIGERSDLELASESSVSLCFSFQYHVSPKTTAFLQVCHSLQIAN